jgi:hypothetical protein
MGSEKGSKPTASKLLATHVLFRGQRCLNTGPAVCNTPSGDLELRRKSRVLLPS